MKMPDYYEFCCPVKTISGNRALDKIPGELTRLGVDNLMLCTDRGIVQAGLLTTIKDILNSAAVKIAAVYDSIPADSDLQTVREAAQIYQGKTCNVILAIGGGSVIDTAKAVNILVSENSDDLRQFTGAGSLKRPLKPLIVVPTTAGTGSELTQVAVIADHKNKVKLPFPSHFILPDIAVLDPRMTETLPAALTAATAMDALTHACEAYTNLQKNPVSDEAAFSAIRLIAKHLLPVIKKPQDQLGRLALANGAALAGMAFSNSMVGLVHTLGHSVGGVCNVPHGIAMAIFLPYGLKYNLPKNRHLTGELLYALTGPEIYANTPEQDRATKVITWIRDFNQKLHEETAGRHPRFLKEIGDRNNKSLVLKEHLPLIARTCLGDGSQFYNPEEADYEDYLHILNRAWDGSD